MLTVHVYREGEKVFLTQVLNAKGLDQCMDDHPAEQVFDLHGTFQRVFGSWGDIITGIFSRTEVEDMLLHTRID